MNIRVVVYGAAICHVITFRRP